MIDFIYDDNWDKFHTPRIYTYLRRAKEYWIQKGNQKELESLKNFKDSVDKKFGYPKRQPKKQAVLF